MKTLKVLMLPALLLLPLTVFAQNGGTVPPSTTTPNPQAATSTPATSTPRPSGAVPSVRATTTPRTTTITPVRISPFATTSSPATTTPTAGNMGSNLLLWAALAALVVIPFGFLAVRSLTSKKSKEETNDNSGCFNIKKMLEQKIAEITDLKGKIEGKVQDKARDKLGEALQGTAAAEALALLLRAEKQYGKLKKLYEECLVEFERHAFKGTIIEQSLSDTRALDKVHIEKTYTAGDWTLNEVLVSGSQIPELSKYLNDGPWQIRFWKSGQEGVKVVFKNKVFDIKRSDRSTWISAVAYGQSLGIPLEQLDLGVTS